MSLELRFERLTKAAVAFSSYMYSVAKLLKILHIPTLFTKYIMDSSEIICLRVQHLFVLYKKIIREDTSYFHFENPDRITTVRG
jgi:hypothetical protein